MGQVAIQSRNSLITAVLLGFLFLLLLPLQAKAVRNESVESGVVQNSTVNVLHSDESGISFEVIPPALVRNEVDTEQGTYEQIRMEGYDYIGAVGQPDLPQKGFLIALPPGAEPVLNVLSTNSEVIPNVKVAPTVENTWLNVEEDPTAPGFAPEFEASYPFDAAVYDLDANYPTSPVSLGKETDIRHQRAIWVTVNPVQANPAQQSLTVYSHLEIEISFEFPNGRPNVETLAPISGSFAGTLQSNLLNFEESLNWRTPSASESALMPEVSPCMDANAFRIAVQQDGMYSVSHAALTSAYSSFPASVPANKLRLCYENQEVRIKVNDGGDGNFQNGDSIVFYGEGIKTQETETNIYWLTYSTSGANGLRMTAGTESAAGTAPGHYIPTFHLETDAKYLSLIPASDLNDHWYWADPLEAKAGFDTLNVNFQMTNKASGIYNFTVRAEIWGFVLDEDHDFEIKLNGTSIGTGNFYGSGVTDNYIVFEADAPASVLLNGSNTVSIIALDTDAIPTNTGHKILVNWIEIEPRRQFVAENNRLGFTQESAGTYSLAVGSLPTGASIDIYNVTDPANINVQTKTAAGGSVSFNRTLAADSDFQVYANTAYLSPQSITKDTIGSGILATGSNTADLIIITVPALDSALNPLRTQRNGQGLTVKTVFVQDIFDEFGYGRYATYAIKDFLNYAYDNWSGDLEYVLLAGDGSYDHRNVTGGNGNSNLVPVFLRSGIDSRLGEAASDNQYVNFNGDDLAEMMLGRLPAQTNSELANMVTKILQYENGEANPSWRGRHMFVADNPYIPPSCDPDPAGDFFATVNNFINDHFPDNQILTRVFYAPTECFPNNSGPYTTYEGYYYASSIDSVIINHYNFGNQFIVYTGHSGTQNWAAENLFSTASVPGLNNGNRTPIMLTMTCLEGWYHFSGSTSGLSEAQLKRVGGGAVAAFAPTGFQVQHGHDLILTGFYDAVYTTEVVTIGEATYQGKLELDSVSPAYDDLHDTFILLGDPSMQFNLPQNVSQTFLPAGFR